MSEEQAIYEMTRPELVRAYRKYSDYDQVGSTERAAKFIQAARQLLLLTPKRSASQVRGDEVEMSPEVMQAELTKAEAWFHQNGGVGSLTGEPRKPTQYTIDECWRDY